jgi:hypothetical protein
MLESKPPELQAPGMWLPRHGSAHVLLPFVPGRRAANPHWIEEILGARASLKRGPGNTWVIARGRADEMLRAMRERFEPGTITLITDAAEQRKCGPQCWEGNPDRALECECQCGGENHGGVSEEWVLRGRFAIETTVQRRIFQI